MHVAKGAPRSPKIVTLRSPLCNVPGVLHGGARIETWGYKHAGINGTSADGGPCTLCSRGDVACTTLACRLNRVMTWQLHQMRRAGGKYGLFIVADPHHTGAPQTDMGLSSASSMWDQVSVGLVVAGLFTIVCMLYLHLHF